MRFNPFAFRYPQRCRYPAVNPTCIHVEAGTGIRTPYPWLEACRDRNVCIEYYGCTYNEGDAALLREVLRVAGSTLLPDATDAEVVILISCVVVDRTERNMLRRIHHLAGREIWVTGCLPEARPGLISGIPRVRVFSPSEIQECWNEIRIVSPRAVGVVQIGPGCVGSCTYCITRRARGRIKSRDPGDILEHIRVLAEAGTVEIRLTGQDLSAYGLDRGQATLPGLLARINEIPGSFRVRVGMMNPATLLSVAGGVADAIGGDRFFRFVHVPVQSGSDSVLSRMGRGYRTRDAMDMIRLLRSRLPDLTLAIDLICGFPGESEEDHRMNLRLIRDLSPDMVNVTRYSYRPGSGCDRQGELPDRIRKDRSRELVSEAYRLMLEKRLQFVGSEETVMITEHLREGTVMGRTPAYQGVVIRSDLPPGSVCRVRITEARTHYLVGEQLSRSV